MGNLIGVVLGGALVIVSNYLMHRWQLSAEKKSVSQALAGEIAALLDIADIRGYESYLEGVIRQAQANATPAQFWFCLTQEYFSVFKSNVGKLGMLEAPLPGDIARFYAQLFAMLEDIEAMAKGQKYEESELRALLQLFRDTKKLGRDIVRKIDQ